VAKTQLLAVATQSLPQHHPDSFTVPGDPILSRLQNRSTPTGCHHKNYQTNNLRSEPSRAFSSVLFDCLTNMANLDNSGAAGPSALELLS
jgi:hypothetical protein